jgi:hypothetical protein
MFKGCISRTWRHRRYWPVPSRGVGASGAEAPGPVLAMTDRPQCWFTQFRYPRGECGGRDTRWDDHVPVHRPRETRALRRGALLLGAPMATRLLAALFADARRAVARDALIERLWGAHAPATATTPQVYVSQLWRRAGAQTRGGPASLDHGRQLPGRDRPSVFYPAGCNTAEVAEQRQCQPS